jgi:DNA-binding CsgD family transcriptional regulator
MSLSAEQRGDLAEQMLPTAAHLAVLVHGDGGPEDVAKVLGGLDETQKDALIVVLAGLVDPDQSVGKALGWLDFNEHGALTVPSWSEGGSLRDLAPEDCEDDADEYIDEAAVERYLAGARVELSDRERLEAVVRGVSRGLAYPDIDVLQGRPRGATATFVSRLRKRYAEQGRPFPVIRHSGQSVELTAAQVVEMRELYARGGITDLEVALRYGMNRKTVSNLLSGMSYRDAGGPIRAPRGSRPVEASRKHFNGNTGRGAEAVEAG